MIPDGEYNANLITSIGNVVASSDVIFTASDSIVLKVGFSAKNDFIAKIGANEGVTRHYVGGIEYFDGEMEAIYHEAGRIVFEDGNMEYEYRLSDHLGNTRSVFKDNGSGVAEQIQQDDYYAFGLAFEDSFKEYAYTFGNKEVQSELGLDWLDFGARCYAKDIGRWVQVDPLATIFHSHSPYNYTYNNPTRYNDPSGMATEEPDKRPELLNPSKDLYGREGGSHVTGQSGVFDLNDNSKSRQADQTVFTTYLVNDTDAKKSYQRPANSLTSREMVTVARHITDIFSQSGISADVFSFRFLTANEGKQLGNYTEEYELFLAFINQDQDALYPAANASLPEKGAV